MVDKMPDLIKPPAHNNPDIIEWSDAFLLGFPPMDNIHHEFVYLVGQLQTAPDAELPALLETFIIHVQKHFDEEKAWMIDTDFPPRDCHIDEHDAVMNSVLEVRGLLAQGNTTICRELAYELASWFPGHTDYLDSALSHWLCQKRLGGKPVVLRRNMATHHTEDEEPN